MLFSPEELHLGSMLWLLFLIMKCTAQSRFLAFYSYMDTVMLALCPTRSELWMWVPSNAHGACLQQHMAKF